MALEWIRREVFFSGRVQGVGFRYTVNSIAANYRVTGFVRNLPDGRVHLVAEGTEGEVGRFVAAIESRMSDNIQQAEKSLKTTPNGEFDTFQIRF